MSVSCSVETECRGRTDSVASTISSLQLPNGNHMVSEHAIEVLYCSVQHSDWRAGEVAYAQSGYDRCERTGLSESR